MDSFPLAWGPLAPVLAPALPESGFTPFPPERAPLQALGSLASGVRWVLQAHPGPLCSAHARGPPPAGTLPVPHPLPLFQMALAAGPDQPAVGPWLVAMVSIRPHAPGRWRPGVLPTVFQPLVGAHNMPASSSVEAAPGGSRSLGLQRPQFLQVRCPGHPPSSRVRSPFQTPI